MSEGFQPLDAIRSSYRLQRRELPTAHAEQVDHLFQPARSSIADTAWACTVYSMVPYLGILFVPVALAVSGFGYLTARNEPERSDSDSTLIPAGLSLILLAIQIFLWWLLYIIPEIGAVSG